jgi:hypothetical protein
MGKNWVNCAFWQAIAQASELSFPVFHTENCAVHSGNPTVSSVYLQTANDSLVLIHNSHTHKKTHRTDQKTDKPVLCQRKFSSVFRAVSLHSKTAHFNLGCMGPLRRKSAAVRLLRLWVLIPLGGGGMDVFCECCVLWGRGLCGELITRPEESYRVWYDVVCDLEKLMN